jgi:hypothetical protein
MLPAKFFSALFNDIYETYTKLQFGITLVMLNLNETEGAREIIAYLNFLRLIVKEVLCGLRF